jgi:hypothetical protein
MEEAEIPGLAATSATAIIPVTTPGLINLGLIHLGLILGSIFISQPPALPLHHLDAGAAVPVA